MKPPSPVDSPRTSTVHLLKLRRWTFLCLLLCVSAALREVSAAPPDSSDLRLAAPITTWDEALPLGNGLLGGLLWGEVNTLRLSLDRGDLWDNRVNPRFADADYTWKFPIHRSSAITIS